MNHPDPLCLTNRHPASWAPEMCICDVLQQARRDELIKLVDHIDDAIKHPTLQTQRLRQLIIDRIGTQAH